MKGADVIDGVDDSCRGMTASCYPELICRYPVSQVIIVQLPANKQDRMHMSTDLADYTQ